MHIFPLFIHSALNTLGDSVLPLLWVSHNEHVRAYIFFSNTDFFPSIIYIKVRSYRRSVFSLLMISHTVFYTLFSMMTVLVWNSTKEYIRIPFSPYPPWHLLFLSYCWWLLLSQWPDISLWFWLTFPWWLYLSHTSVSHLYLFFAGMSIHHLFIFFSTESFVEKKSLQRSMYF